MATVIVYLQAPDEGGDTIFPKKGIRIHPKPGDALLFWDLTPTGEGDESTEHAGEPVISGTKWAMTKWIRQKKGWWWYSYLTKEEQQKVDEEDQKYLQMLSKREDY